MSRDKDRNKPNHAKEPRRSSLWHFADRQCRASSRVRAELREALRAKSVQVATGVRQTAGASAKHLDFIAAGRNTNEPITIKDDLVDIAGWFFSDCQQLVAGNAVP